jgi:hypothetical protein
MVLVLQIAIPVVLAPLVGGESWSSTPLGGAVLGIALALLSLGVLVLAGSRAVVGVLAEDPDDQGTSASTSAAALGSPLNE